MRIAFVVHDYQRAGVGQTRYVKELASRFSGNHEVHVFANRIEGAEEPGVHFHHVPAWRMNALTTVLTFAVSSTVQVKGSFDIIHSQGFCGFYGNVFTAHICNRAWHLALRKLEGGVSLRELIFNSMATTLEYFTYRRARECEVISVSARVADDIKRHYHCPARMHVIHHGVNHRIFSNDNRLHIRAAARRELGLDGTDFAFLYVGNLRKGARRCLFSLSRLEQGTLICVSPTQSQPYRALAEQLGLGNRVRFIDFTERVEKMYFAADALLVPSPYDAFAMVVTEGMAAGLPVVVSREAGASELIQHGVNGLRLDDLTSDAELTGLMRSLETDRAWAQGLGRAGQQTAEIMTWDSVAQRTMGVYEELMRLGTQAPNPSV